MTSHYEIYKAKIDALKKAGVDKQHHQAVRDYLDKKCSSLLEMTNPFETDELEKLDKLGIDTQYFKESRDRSENLAALKELKTHPQEIGECSDDISDDLGIDAVFLPPEIIAIKNYVSTCFINEEGILEFPKPNANGVYPVKFVAALQYDDSAKIFDILGAVRHFSDRQDIKNTEDNKIAISLLEEIFPLLECHNFISDCSIDDFIKILSNKSSTQPPCAYCIIRLMMVFELIRYCGINEKCSDAVEEIRENHIAQLLERLKKSLTKGSSLSKSKKITEDKLKDDWEMRRHLIANHKIHHGGIMNTSIKIKLSPHNPLVVIDTLDKYMSYIFHSPGAISQQAGYIDDVVNMSAWIWNLSKNDGYDKPWLEPYKIYANTFLSKFAPPEELLLSMLYGEPIGLETPLIDNTLENPETIFGSVSCELPDDLKKITIKRISRFAKQSIREAAKEISCALSPVDAGNWQSIKSSWPIVRNILASHMAKIFVDVHGDVKITYLTDNAEKYFYIPKTGSVVDISFAWIFSAYDVAFEAVDKMPKDEPITNWLSVKNWINYANDNFQALSLDWYDGRHVNHESKDIDLLTQYFDCDWNKQVAEEFKQLRDYVIEKLHEVFDFVCQQEMLSSDKAEIFRLLATQCVFVDNKITRDMIDKLKELEGEHNNNATPKSWEIDLDKIVSRDKERCKRERKKLQKKGTETRKTVLLEMSHSIKNLIATIVDPLDQLRGSLADEDQKVDVENALTGAKLIRELALQVHMSIRGEPGTWRRDWGNVSGSRMESIVEQALRHAVNNMFSGKYFGRFTQAYFGDSLERYYAAKEAIASACGLNALSASLEQYFFNCQIEFAEEFCTVRVGDAEGTATKLLILFQEILLNAVKYTSLVERERRFMTIRMAERKDGFTFEVINSAVEGETAENPSGIGHIVISNFAELFQAKLHAGFTADGNYDVKLDFSL